MNIEEFAELHLAAYRYCVEAHMNHGAAGLLLIDTETLEAAYKYPFLVTSAPKEERRAVVAIANEVLWRIRRADDQTLLHR